jgi:Tfp pilus assembly protein PilN
MIRINLNRTRVAGGLEGEETVIKELSTTPSLNVREVIVKLLVVFLGIIGLMIYERQNIDALNAELGKTQADLNSLKQQVNDKNAELAKLKDIEPLANGLNEKLRALREYSKERITELQSLDFMQSIIPERVWLRNVHFEKHRYQILGNAVETVDLTDFVNKLENSAYFKDVIVIQDKEKPVQNGKIRDFEFTAREQAAN